MCSYICFVHNGVDVLIFQILIKAEHADILLTFRCLYVFKVIGAETVVLCINFIEIAW